MFLKQCKQIVEKAISSRWWAYSNQTCLNGKYHYINIAEANIGLQVGSEFLLVVVMQRLKCVVYRTQLALPQVPLGRGAI